MRNKFFDIHWLRSFQFDVFTVGIGNLSIGGTGKTPHVLWLNKQFEKEETAVLSRGYGRKGEDFHQVTKDSKPIEVGDEPLMMKLSQPGKSFYVCADRVVGITNIMFEKPETQMVILDDNMQHRFITPHFQIMLTTFDQPFFNDFTLPSGNLREFRIGAKRANMVIVTKCPNGIEELQKKKYKEAIKKYTSAPIYFSTYVYANIIEHQSMVKLEKDARVILICGIANEVPLIKSISERYHLVESIIYPDHHQYNIHNLVRIQKKLAQKEYQDINLVTTEKDYVKLRNTPALWEIAKSFPLYIQTVEVAFLDGGESVITELLQSRLS